MVTELKELELKEDVLNTLLHDLDRVFDVTNGIDDEGNDFKTEFERFTSCKKKVLEMLVKAEQLDEELEAEIEHIKVTQTNIFKRFGSFEKDKDYPDLKNKFQVISTSLHF